MSLVALETVKVAVMNVVADVSGIRIAPYSPTEAVVISGVTGQCSRTTSSYAQSASDGVVEATHTFQLYLMTPNRNYRTDAERLEGLGQNVALALLADTTLGGLSLNAEALHCDFGPYMFNEQPMLAWDILIEVRVAGSLT